MLDFPPDITFAIQFVAFFALFFALDRLLFRPYADVLARRDARTIGASQTAETDQQAVRALQERINEAMAAARAEAQVQAEAIRRDARAEEASLYERAKGEAASRLAAIDAAIQGECSAARTTLEREAGSLAERMTRLVLGEKA
jgi:F-type H+-transporting ATPase subunit b